ncbi:hypothetical protein scyTo_0000184 [Scyliorhinus torazame]|uniref:Uncharacterized protein n=1 Tax=Scyliorhinus torazame TaxID=75743 RepID=A0A401NS23_SCYTO|nr:hypothetical protein [Scyliorhinus torazame]
MAAQSANKDSGVRLHLGQHRAAGSRGAERPPPTLQTAFQQFRSRRQMLPNLNTSSIFCHMLFLRLSNLMTWITKDNEFLCSSSINNNHINPLFKCAAINKKRHTAQFYPQFMMPSDPSNSTILQCKHVWLVLPFYSS